MAISELTISATEFKAKCLELLDRVESRKIKRLIVTKRGKAVADVTAHAKALKPLTKKHWNPFAGLGISVIAPKGFDFTAPVYAPKIDGDIYGGAPLKRK